MLSDASRVTHHAMRGRLLPGWRGAHRPTVPSFHAVVNHTAEILAATPLPRLCAQQQSAKLIGTPAKEPNKWQGAQQRRKQDLR
jgi:hypothetical protein